MSTMSKYCKAYELRDLRAYPRWSEPVGERSAAQAGGETPEPLNDDTIVYVHDNYTVTEGVILDEQVIFDAVDEEWRQFCDERLDFKVPDDAVDTAA